MENNYFKIALSPLTWHKYAIKVKYTLLELQRNGDYKTYNYTNFDYALHHYHQNYGNLLYMNVSTDGYHYTTCIFHPDGYWEVAP